MFQPFSTPAGRREVVIGNTLPSVTELTASGVYIRKLMHILFTPATVLCAGTVYLQENRQAVFNESVFTVC